MSVTRENIVSTNEKNNHLKYIKEHKDMDKVVYKYTQSSLELRKSPSEMKKLNNLIKNAPLLKKEYTVYNMKSDYDKVLRIDGKNLENSNEIEADELVVGDIFTQESLWDTDKDKQNNILSTTMIGIIH
jgi:DNA-binding Lrp family transcriptional regulator